MNPSKDDFDLNLAAGCGIGTIVVFLVFWGMLVSTIGGCGDHQPTPAPSLLAAGIVRINGHEFEVESGDKFSVDGAGEILIHRKGNNGREAYGVTGPETDDIDWYANKPRKSADNTIPVHLGEETQEIATTTPVMSAGEQDPPEPKEVVCPCCSQVIPGMKAAPPSISVLDKLVPDTVRVGEFPPELNATEMTRLLNDPEKWVGRMFSAPININVKLMTEDPRVDYLPVWLGYYGGPMAWHREWVPSRLGFYADAGIRAAMLAQNQDKQEQLVVLVSFMIMELRDPKSGEGIYGAAVLDFKLLD